MKIDDVVAHWTHAWRSLAAWGAPLPATIVVEPWKGRGALGRAMPPTRGSCGTVKVMVTGDLAEDLATALHELAHLAAPNFVSHEEPWRRVFVAATAEVCDADVDMFDVDVVITDLDAQVRDAVAGWLTRSGQYTVLRAIGVIP